MLFRRIASIYVLYFYLAGTGIVSNLTATPAASSTTHPLRRRCTLIRATTLYLSDLISYLANCLGPLCLYIAPLASFSLCGRFNSVS